MAVTVDLAPIEAKPIVGRLLEFNEYEFSRIDSRSIGPDGKYGYPYLDQYWDPREQRTPYLIRVDNELAGLALVRLLDQVTAFAEFLILPKFRRTGIGTEAATRIIRSHPGRWELTQVPGNGAAVAFWRRAIPVPFDEGELPDGTTRQTFIVDA